MSAAAAPADAAPKKGNKKLIIIIAAVLLLVLGGGGAAFMMMKNKKAAEEAAAEEGGGAAHKPAAKKPAAKDPAAVPTFVPLDPFTVNLADRDAERYAQIGITLEVDDPKVGDQIKNYMPAIRNNILMVLSTKTAAQLLELEGKEKLARQIRRESVRPLGYELEDEDEEEDPDADAEDKPKKKKKKRVEEYAPVTAVHFSNFIVQ